MKPFVLKLLVLSLFVVLVALVLSALKNLGILNFYNNNYITVTGVSSSEELNTLATFNATIESKDADKNKAVDGLDAKSENVINKIKEFGIDENNIKTLYYNVYQYSEWDPVLQKSKFTDWVAIQTLEVKLKDVSKASEFGTMLSKLDISNVSGPDFRTSDEQLNDEALLAAAVSSAKTKAEMLAEAGGRKLGKMVSVTEGRNQTPLPMYGEARGGGALDMEPGTTEIQKTVTVTFLLY